MKEDLQHLNVVFIGNEKDSHEAIREAMRNSGIKAQIRMIKNGPHINRWLISVSELPTVIFIDIDSEKNKHESVLNLIRANKRFVNVPVIILSQSTYIEQIRTTFENGANLYLPKPVFSICRSKALQTIFTNNWKERLLNRNKNSFVINHALSNSSEPGLHAY